jgi:hypothetical protein
MHPINSKTTPMMMNVVRCFLLYIYIYDILHYRVHYNLSSPACHFAGTNSKDVTF